MVQKVVITGVVLFVSVWATAQTSMERSALNNIQKKRWEQAYEQLTKALQRDSVHAAAQYALAQYFFAPENPDFQIDSAYQHTLQALEDYHRSPMKIRDRLRKIPLDSLILVRYREKIDSAAFARARQADTEQAYLHFLSYFTTAQQYKEAEGLRDEAAYLDAEEENTYEAFARFIQQYPDAKRAAQARVKYEQLLFETKTRDKRLSSYKNFLKEHPHTPYRREAEQAIFEISTADGSIEHFETFLREYPESYLAAHAREIGYHLIAEESHEISLPPLFQHDSLTTTGRQSRSYLIPFLKYGRFGFMDPSGAEIIPAVNEEIDDGYLCGNITEDVIVLADKLLTRQGEVIFSRTAEALDDLGYGFLKVTAKGCIQVLHKTGMMVGDSCVQDAKLLNGRLLAIQRDSLWSVWTLTGKRLQPYTWNDIDFIENVLLYQQHNQITLATVQAVGALADQQSLTATNAYDEAKRWGDNHIWVRAGQAEGILDQTLSFHVKMDNHVLKPTFFGSAAQSAAGIILFNRRGEPSPPFNDVKVSAPWVAVKNDSTWRLFDPETNQDISGRYDSIQVTANFAATYKRDSARIYFSPQTFLDFAQPVQVEFVPGQDSASFLLIEHNGKKTLYSAVGKKLFQVAYERIQHAGENFFIVHKKEKKGLIGADGKVILPVEYDAIGSTNNGILSMLRAMKFGLFNIEKLKTIAPGYDKNLTLYNKDVITAFKNGAYGFIDWTNKPLSKFEFNEVTYWNDTTALVRKNDHWVFYNLKDKAQGAELFKSFKLIRDTPQEKIAILRKENNYGVFSSVKGVIIPPTFSDIVNVGSAEHPTYFTEKHVEEAAIFVVIYYNGEGEMIRREVYEHIDYDRIYCSQ